jgi:hypothetical protein
MLTYLPIAEKSRFIDEAGAFMKITGLISSISLILEVKKILIIKRNFTLI